jgi:transcriptional regulator with XRE-family HTH domain
VPKQQTKLAAYLAEHGIRLSEFARQTGMTRMVLWHYVAGDRRPGLKYALAIAKATNDVVPAEYWAAFTPRKPRKSRRARSTNP